MVVEKGTIVVWVVAEYWSSLSCHLSLLELLDTVYSYK